MSPTLAKSLLPSWTSNLFDSGNFFSRGIVDIDRDFDEFNFAVRLPHVNIVENAKDFMIEMAAPGMQKKDFKVNVDSGTLTISAEKESETKEVKKNYTRREYSFNSFSRSFRLPENCLSEKIDAKYENGILHLALPKKEVTLAPLAKEIKVF